MDDNSSNTMSRGSGDNMDNATELTPTNSLQNVTEVSGPSSTERTLPDSKKATQKADHVELTRVKRQEREHHEGTSTAILTMPVMDHIERQHQPKKKGLAFPQYGFLARALVDTDLEEDKEGKVADFPDDRLIYFNISSPSSTFICGSQGSGKSYTLSCMLENALFASKASVLPRPLTALVFHYDTFSSGHGGTPCEAACLASRENVKVRVLCAPTNIATIKKVYSNPKIRVEPLKINQTDLNTERMIKLMAVKQADMPLYMHTIIRMLGDMRKDEQESGKPFNYAAFRKSLDEAEMATAQMGPLNQRLAALESFMPANQTTTIGNSPKGKNKGKKKEDQKKKSKSLSGNNWIPEGGLLTIVDLSCPCVTAEGACTLFNICLSLFLEGAHEIGRFVALDEAHKYMKSSAEASTLTEALCGAIREQRHIGTRIAISTQEPTISPVLLDLSTVTIVHRFTSPAWFQTLKGHLAGLASNKERDNSADDRIRSASGNESRVFNEIVKLRVGEALLFSPSAIIGVKEGRPSPLTMLGVNYMKILVRKRLTVDLGGSVRAD